jgi:hypothetical protein
VTSSQGNPELRSQAQDLLDEQRQIRKQVDEMRIEEKAKQKLQETV